MTDYSEIRTDSFWVRRDSYTTKAHSREIRKECSAMIADSIWDENWRIMRDKSRLIWDHDRSPSSPHRSPSCRTEFCIVMTDSVVSRECPSPRNQRGRGTHSLRGMGRLRFGLGEKPSTLSTLWGEPLALSLAGGRGCRTEERPK
jgi:hypothetical protein